MEVTADRRGTAAGGGVDNAGGTLSSTASLAFLANVAKGGAGGIGGHGGSGLGGHGGAGGDGTGGNGGNSGSGSAAAGGTGGDGGDGSGGGLLNLKTAAFGPAPRKASKLSTKITFTSNQADGGSGATGGLAGDGLGGSGGNGGANGAGGTGGPGNGGVAGPGGSGGDGNGGGISNDGPASFTGVTLVVNANQAGGGAGGQAQIGSTGTGEVGGEGHGGASGGTGGPGSGGIGGNGGNGGDAEGGGIFASNDSNLLIDPTKNTRKNPRQPTTIDSITANLAIAGTATSGGLAGDGIPGQGGAPLGAEGTSFDGDAGLNGTAGTGVGGGLFLDPVGARNIKSTTVTGNNATSSDNDVHAPPMVSAFLERSALRNAIDGCSVCRDAWALHDDHRSLLGLRPGLAPRRDCGLRFDRR